MSNLTSQERADLLQLAMLVHPDLDRTLLTHLAGETKLCDIIRISDMHGPGIER